MKRLLPLLSLILLSSCASGTQIGSRIDDIWLGTKVRSRLTSGAISEQMHVNVDVRSGVVTLNGWVTTEEEKTKVEEMVKPLRGVREVVNNLSVGEPPPSAEEPAAPAPAPGREGSGTNFPSSR